MEGYICCMDPTSLRRIVFLKYVKDLFIIIIKVELFDHTNITLLTSTLGGLQNYS